jgi:hypothetical protein
VALNNSVDRQAIIPAIASKKDPAFLQTICHPEETTCLRQVKREMNAKSILILLALFFVH